VSHPSDGRTAFELILPSVLFDEDWYAVQVGAGFPDRERAVAHYVAHAAEGSSPHPLFSAEWVFPNAGWRARGSDPLSSYLAGGKRFERAPHPLLHLGRIAEADPRAADHPLGPADHWLRNAGVDQVLPSPRGAVPMTLGELRAALSPARLAAEGSVTEAVHGRTTVVLPLLARPLSAVEWLFGTFREHPDLDVELLVLVPEDSPFLRVVTEVARSVRNARALPVPDGVPWATAANAGLDAAAGDVVVFLSTHARSPYWSWLGPLRDALTDGVSVAQPLLLAEDHTIAAAGATFLAGRVDRTPLLEGLAGHDAARLPDGRLPGVVGVVAVRTADARALGGMDASVPDAWAVTDLGVRAWRERRGGAAVAARAQLVLRDPLPLDDVPDSLRSNLPEGSAEAWRAVGLEPSVDAAGVVTASPVRLDRVTEGPPRLRWTLDLPVTAGPWGAVWGDRYFGEALARALERQGQHVTLDPRESRGRATRDLDDVVLVIRGRDRVVPRGSALHALWVISHPDDVTAAEAAAFDLVFAASSSWSAEHSRAWGLDVHPLLQATEPKRFHPGRAESGGHPLLFVGNARGGVPRPSVALSLLAGLRPAIYGSGWVGLVDPSLVVADHVDNAELGRLYASAGVVLNDHWEDMRRQGFVSNRVFDVAASGAPLITDDVAGVEALDGIAVQAVRTAGELRAAVERWLRNPVDRVGAAARVQQQHSFDARARTLLEHVLPRSAR